LYNDIVWQLLYKASIIFGVVAICSLFLVKTFFESILLLSQLG